MYDVVIVGAGYAGSSLSGQLEKLKDVLVIDEKGVGEKSTSISSFLKILDDEVVLNEYDEYTIMTVDGESYTYEFDEPVLGLVDYKKLCERAVSHDVHRARVEEYGDGYVKLSDGEVIRAKVVVDCTGVYGQKLRARFGLPSPPFRVSLSFAEIENGGSGIRSNSLYLIVGHANLGGWIYPVDNTKSEFGFAQGSRKGEAEFPELGQVAETMGFRMHKDTTIKRSEYAFGFVKKVVRGSVVLFGDSCGLVHPTYIMGIHYIHRFAPILAEHVAGYLRGEKTSLEKYQRLWREALKRAADNIARGYAIWDLPVDEQIRVTKVQIRAGIKPESILDHMWAFDEKFQVFAKNPPKLWDFPLRLYLNYIRHRLSFTFR
ncbi:NAD(P)/FAD-dependent oxidoreductase [Geoglobus ahangari]